MVENMTELVKVDVQCPFCGECYHRMVKIKPSSIRCRAYSKLTRKELEAAGFGWVFDCEGIEIEEVE